MIESGSQPSVFVLVLNFNGGEKLLSCLSSVFQSDFPRFEVVVVDNCSTDGSLDTARRNFSRAHFIKNSSNAGFAKGNNLGLRFALEKFADYVFVLNNDAVVEKNTISQLVQEADGKQAVGILSPLVLSADGKTVWFSGGKIDWVKMRAVHDDAAVPEHPYPTEYVCGCAMLVNKDVFKKIGLFDERFFLYYEDADFSLRAKKAGFSLLMVPSATVTHLEQSAGRGKSKTYWLVFSGLLFFRIHASSLQKTWLFFYLQLRKLKNISDLVFAKNESALQTRQAYRDFKKNSP
jgi:GT2 family glycosyltransferase